MVQGEFDQVWIQIYTALGTLAYSFVITYGILYILDKIPVLGLRVSDSNEDQGLDLSEHGEQSSIEDGAN